MKLRDHFNYTGLYLVTVHNNWKLKCWIPDYIPNVFHNLRGYDAHLFNNDFIKLIAENKEKHISLMSISASSC